MNINFWYIIFDAKGYISTNYGEKYYGSVINNKYLKQLRHVEKSLEFHAGMTLEEYAGSWMK